jgi:hypothetical protein
MSRIKSKSKPMPEDFLPRFRIEEERSPSELIDRYSVEQRSRLWIDGQWEIISRVYSTMATHKISEDAELSLVSNSKDKAKIKKLKEDSKKELKIKK